MKIAVVGSLLALSTTGVKVVYNPDVAANHEMDPEERDAARYAEFRARKGGDRPTFTPPDGDDDVSLPGSLPVSSPTGSVAQEDEAIEDHASAAEGSITGSSGTGSVEDNNLDVTLPQEDEVREGDDVDSLDAFHEAGAALTTAQKGIQAEGDEIDAYFNAKAQKEADAFRRNLDDFYAEYDAKLREEREAKERAEAEARKNDDALRRKVDEFFAEYDAKLREEREAKQRAEAEARKNDDALRRDVEDFFAEYDAKLREEGEVKQLAAAEAWKNMIQNWYDADEAELRKEALEKKAAEEERKAMRQAVLSAENERMLAMRLTRANERMLANELAKDAVEKLSKPAKLLAIKDRDLPVDGLTFNWEELDLAERRAKFEAKRRMPAQSKEVIPLPDKLVADEEEATSVSSTTSDSEAAVTSATAKPFQQLPSVGTWLHQNNKPLLSRKTEKKYAQFFDAPLDAVEDAEVMRQDGFSSYYADQWGYLQALTAQAQQEATNVSSTTSDSEAAVTSATAKPFHQLPSVGTWLHQNNKPLLSRKTTEAPANGGLEQRKKALSDNKNQFDKIFAEGEYTEVTQSLMNVCRIRKCTFEYNFAGEKRSGTLKSYNWTSDDATFTFTRRGTRLHDTSVPVADILKVVVGKK